MKEKMLRDFWLREEKESFRGWDFSYIDERWVEEDLPWDYCEIVRNNLKNHMKLLDIGTGGGELLLGFGHPFHRTYAVEAWEPNYKLCLKKLVPLGINVSRMFNDKLPYEDESFHIVIDKHESFDVDEVWRVLKPGGVFITQQVGRENNYQLSKYIYPDYKNEFVSNDLMHNQVALEEKGFKIEFSKEYFPYLRFKDVGAFVYFAKIIQWEFPEFSVERNYEELLTLHKEVLEKGYFESREHRFMIVCRKTEE